MARQPTDKATKTGDRKGAVTDTMMEWPVQRPYPGLRSVPAKTIRRAVRAVVRQRALESGS